jgi:hypothetical protein
MADQPKETQAADSKDPHKNDSQKKDNKPTQLNGDDKTKKKKKKNNKK